MKVYLIGITTRADYGNPGGTRHVIAVGHSVSDAYEAFASRFESILREAHEITMSEVCDTDYAVVSFAEDNVTLTEMIFTEEPE